MIQDSLFEESSEADDLSPTIVADTAIRRNHVKCSDFIVGLQVTENAVVHHVKTAKNTMLLS